MMRRSSTFISGVLAVGIYTLLIGILLFYFNTRETQKPLHYVKKNEDRIRVTMAAPENKAEMKTNQPSKKKSEPKKKPIAKPKTKQKETVKKQKDTSKKVIKEKVVKKVKPKPKPKKVVKKEPPKKVNKPKSLFDNVKAKKQSNKPTNTKVENQKVSKSSTSASKLFNDSIKVQKPSDRGIENAYLAKIEDKLHGWPAQSEYAGEKAKVWLKVKPSGKFEFRVITASANEDFNIGLVAYLRQLQGIGFGPHKAKRAYELNVEFVATE